MSSFALKKMETPEEAAGAARVRAVAWQEAYSDILPPDAVGIRTLDYCLPGMLRILTSPDVETVIAKEATGEIVGFIVFGRCRDEDLADGCGEVQALYTLAKTYGSGLGHALIACALDALSEAGLGNKTAVWTLEGNLRARAFYRKEGFVEDGVSKELPTLGDGILDIRMLRENPSDLL